ncbi:hypothetical protein GYMLUDRAFT_252121 [Collybiopsis luxurians FD-317 M1]|uniref:Uncharacterized protein n=1 Tax=Collybiopsis luxurians FD-317 M1 TaxID=944289 RepID=A0A0D0AM72_9AGAR|nr:hypothetical protein GYMLUDRAFT_252121 [Collybiopsis luxurians FD-317 M1]
MSSKESHLFKSLTNSYTEEDRIRAFSSQPLDHLPSYLQPSSVKQAKPPVLHRGWIIDTSKIFLYVEKYCPESCRFIGIPPKADHEGTCASMSGHGNPLLALLLEKLGIVIPSVLQSRILITYFCDGESHTNEGEKLRFLLGLSIGTNYDGVIPAEHESQLNEVFASGIPARWFLDRNEFQWKKSRKCLPGPPCYFSLEVTDKSKYLFLPQGVHYTNEDGFKAFASQPLDLLPRYLIPDSSKRFRPPHLYLGWLIDKSELFQYAQKQIPDAVVFESDESVQQLLLSPMAQIRLWTTTPFNPNSD